MEASWVSRLRSGNDPTYIGAEHSIRWIPAYAGMTQCYHEERAQQPWIPAYVGMTQYYHGERAQQPWIPAIPALVSPVIPAKAGIHWASR